MRLTVAVHTILVACLVSTVAAFAVNNKSQIKVGDKVPYVDLDWGFPPQKVNLPSYCMGRNVLIVGLPGAFTPT
jgi:hypothetical protein